MTKLDPRSEGELSRPRERHAELEARPELQRGTQRRLADALLESEERYRALVEDMPALVCRFLPDGVLTFVNSAYCKYFSKTKHELVGHDFFQFIPVEDQQKVRDHFLSLTKENPSVTYEHKIIAPDGATRWQEWTDRAIVNELGDVIEYQSLGRDITETKLAAEALRQSERSYRRLAEQNAVLLDQARRDSETKATLLHEVNHRVKNNLSSIIGLLHAEERFASDENRAAIKGVTRKLAARIQGLAAAHQMLSTVQWMRISLTDLAEQIVRLSVQGIAPDKKLNVHVAPSSVLITADQASSLALVINELVTNTLKHALSEREAVSIEISVFSDEGTVRLLFQDDGPGFQPGTLSGKTESIGLYLVDNIVCNNLRGRVERRNEGGAVTEITFAHAG